MGRGYSWPENFIDGKPVPPQTADKAKPFQWEVVSLLREVVSLLLAPAVVQKLWADWTYRSLL